MRHSVRRGGDLGLVLINRYYYIAPYSGNSDFFCQYSYVVEILKNNLIFRNKGVVNPAQNKKSLVLSTFLAV